MCLCVWEREMETGLIVLLTELKQKAVWFECSVVEVWRKHPPLSHDKTLLWYIILYHACIIVFYIGGFPWENICRVGRRTGKMWWSDEASRGDLETMEQMIRSSLFCSYIWLSVSPFLILTLPVEASLCGPASYCNVSTACRSVCVCVCVPPQYVFSCHGNIRSSGL